MDMEGGGIEYEVQVLDVARPEMIRRLKKLGGTMVHKKIKMVRAAFFLCSKKVNGYARVRAEDGQVKMTVKTYSGDYPMEYELGISEGIDEGIEFMKALGLEQKAFQESYREKWTLPIKGVHEITFDSWPGLPMWMEIDCKTESALHKVLRLLEIPLARTVNWAVAEKYNHYYGIPIDVINNKTPSITFDGITSEIRPRRNKNLFRRMSLIKNGSR